MDDPDLSAGFEHIKKELSRLQGELEKENAKPIQQAEVLTGICVQILSHQATLSAFVNLKQVEHMIQLVKQSDKLTKQTDTLIQLIDSTEILTRRLVRLTWAVVLVSIALLVFGVWQTKILIKEDTSDTLRGRRETNHYDLNANGK
jgi:hypothetical protein